MRVKTWVWIGLLVIFFVVVHPQSGLSGHSSSPSTTFALSSSAEQMAIAYVAGRTGLPMTAFTLADERTVAFPTLGQRWQRVTLIHPQPGSLQVYKLLVNPATGQVLEDISVLRLAETQAYKARFGKLEPILYERLQGLADEEAVPVAIWLAAGPGQTLGEQESQVFAAFRQSNQVMSAERGRQMEVEYLKQLTAVMAERTQALVANLAQQGFAVTTYPAMPSVTAVLPKRVILELSTRPDVSVIYLTDAKPQLALESTVPNSLAPIVWGRGYNGAGITIAILENGNVDPNNTFLNHALTNLAAQAGVQDHATRVASAAASFDTILRGVAYGATILSAGNPTNDASGDVFALEWAALQQGAPIVNISEGYDLGDNELYWIDRAFDYWVRQQLVLITTSAGNTGNRIVSPGKGWNLLTVGAYSDYDNLDWSDDEMRTLSAYINPCGNPGNCDGREKPEVVAVGGSVTALGINNIPLTDNGTSFAAPQVAGLGALLIHREPLLEFWPEASRAIIMASATHNIEGESSIRWNDPDDLRDGAGAINAALADEVAQLQGSDLGVCYVSCWWGVSLPDMGNFQSLERRFYADSAFIRVAISWWSNPDTPGNNYSFDRLDTDLDLVIYGPDGNIADFSLSTDNNYEMVEFFAAQAGEYRIEVRKAVSTEPSNSPGMALVRIFLPEQIYLPVILRP